MIDHSRPLAHSDSESEPAARLDDFQVFRRAGPVIYSPYYGHHYGSPYFEPAPEDIGQQYLNLVNARDYSYQEDVSKLSAKPVTEWTELETESWIAKNIVSMDIPEYDFPFHNFKMTGAQLCSLTRDDFRMRVTPSYLPPESWHERHFNLQNMADRLYQNLQSRLSEDRFRQTTVLRYAESDPYSHDIPQSIVDLDAYRNRSYMSDYAPNDSTLLPAFVSEDAEDAFLDSHSESPDYYGSDESNRSDDKERKKNKVGKRPPGRPPGSGAKNKNMKRPKSVSVPDFLRDLLLNPETCPAYIRWEDYSQRKFRFVKPDVVAKRWGMQKNNDNMTFEKFSRAMRYHYRQKVLEAVPSARLVYKFGPKFKPIDGDEDNPNFEKKPIKTEYQPYEPEVYR